MTDRSRPSRRQLPAALVVAATCVPTVVYYVGPHRWPVLGYAYVALGAVLGYRGLQPLRHRRGWLASALIALFWVGSTYLPRAHLSSVPVRVVGVLVAAAQLALVVQLLTGHLAGWTPRGRRRSGAGGRRWLAVYAAIPLASWTTFVLAYAPAKMTFDSFWQWAMAHHTMQYNDWHPFLHTLMIQGSARVYDSPLSYVVLQVLLGSAAVAFAMYTLQRFGAPRWTTVALAAVYAVHPAAGFYAVTMWKDVPFAYLVLVSATMLAWVAWTDGAWLRRPLAFVAFLLVGFLTMHLRANGLPALLLALVVAIVALRPARKVLLAATAALLALHVGWTAVVLPGFHVLRPPATQALAIPTQQIGAVYARGGDVPPDLDRYFSSILPAQRWRADYVPYSVDPIKHDPEYRNGVVDESLGTYVGNWARLLARNPVLFVKAFLDQTSSIWRYSTTDPRARVYVDTFADLSRVPVAVRLVAPGATDGATAVDVSYRFYNPNGCAPDGLGCRLPDRSDCFGEDRCVRKAQYAPRVAAAAAPLVSAAPVPGLTRVYDGVLRRMSSTWAAPLARGALPMLVLLVALAVAARRDRRRLVVFGPALAVLASIAAGMPATDLRYSFGWIVSVPFLVGVALVPSGGAARPLPERPLADDPAAVDATERVGVGAR